MRFDQFDDETALPFNQRVVRQLGQAIRRVRVGRKLCQYQLADASGLARVMLSKYENGRQCPSFPSPVKILQTLDCSAEEFARYVGPWECV
jgi:transcriptional regulator with XRE-family HTH domain